MIVRVGVQVCSQCLFCKFVYNVNMETNNFILQDGLVKRIQTLSAKIGLTTDEIVVLAIESYLQKNGIESPRGWVDTNKSVDTDAIKNLREQGYSLRQIAKITNVAHTTIHKILKSV